MSRLAELIGGLCIASDLANGFPVEKAMRSVILAVETGRHAGHDDETLRDAFYVMLFRYLGCTAFAHEEAHEYGAGDDLGTRNVMSMADASDPIGTVRAIANRVGRGASTFERVRAVSRLLLDGEAMVRHSRAQCDMSMRLAELAGLSDSIRTSLSQVCERYDGRGAPSGLGASALSIAARLSHVADIAEIAHHRYGEAGALDELRRRSGKHLDPQLTRVFLANARPLFDAIAGTSCWERFLAVEPLPHAHAVDIGVVARAFALFADVKSVHTLGHSYGVATLAKGAAAAAGLSPESTRDLEHAALLHDLGRVSVPTGIWDKPGALGPAEWERVRLHAYYTERIVRRAPAWAAPAKIAASAHERLDGNGYHRGVPSSVLGKQERILAAADVFNALTEPRPHRPARAHQEARETLATEAKKSSLDREAVDAVLSAVGMKRAPSTWPRGLSDREVEVLRYVARGKSNKEIGTLLGISPRTVQNHVAHIYDKIGVYSRAGAALFVTENGLLD